MDMKAVANELVRLCNAGKFAEATDRLYSNDIVSVEPMAMQGMERESRGIAAVRAKGEWWEKNHTVHSAKATGPFYHGDDQFAVIFDLDATFTPTGKRTAMQEIAVYTVRDGKVVHERFYYGG